MSPRSAKDRLGEEVTSRVQSMRETEGNESESDDDLRYTALCDIIEYRYRGDTPQERKSWQEIRMAARWVLRTLCPRVTVIERENGERDELHLCKRCRESIIDYARILRCGEIATRCERCDKRSP